MSKRQLSAIRNMFEQMSNTLKEAHAEFVKRKAARMERWVVTGKGKGEQIRGCIA